MKKFVLKSLRAIFIVFCFAWLISKTGLWLLSQSTFYKPSFVASNIEGVDYQTVIFGSSRGLAALSSKQIEEKSGAPSLNLCIADTALPLHYVMIKHFFESGNYTENVVLTLDRADFETSEVKTGDADFKFLPFGSRNYVQDYYAKTDQSKIGLLRNSNWVPFLGFGYYNSQLLFPSLVGLIKPGYKYRFDEKGDYGYPDYLGMKERNEETQVICTDLGNDLLKEVQAYVESKGSRLIIYVAPYLAMEVSTEEEERFQLINHSSLIDDPTLFSDQIHLVSSGKNVATDAFVDELESLLVKN